MEAASRRDFVAEVMAVWRWVVPTGAEVVRYSEWRAVRAWRV